KYPNFLSRHTFAFSSFSLQDAEHNFPRVLVYGGDAKTVMTFNGRPGQKGYERIELMCFNDQKRQFEFRDLAFPQESNDSSEIADLTLSERKRAFVLSPIDGT
ncbi:hypothetical protein, partial [Streptobacillus moniliformis]|uniref:hypothetical protein n=1 Tax=Streptobacillus moniliformis TaxID=34105 RepID=UPI001E5C89D4